MVSLAPQDAVRTIEDLLQRVERGEYVEIVRDGQVVARLVPGERALSAKMDELMARAKGLRSRISPIPEDLKGLAGEGRP